MSSCYAVFLFATELAKLAARPTSERPQRRPDLFRQRQPDAAYIIVDGTADAVVTR
jgi:hypothetical protein